MPNTDGMGRVDQHRPKSTTSILAIFLQIIVVNWEVFEDLLGTMEWAKATLNSLEKSRNIIMHRGSVAKEDVERIGMNIRDWIRQAG
jgi:hypothetical protein